MPFRRSLCEVLQKFGGFILSIGGNEEFTIKLKNRNKKIHIFRGEGKLF